MTFIPPTPLPVKRELSASKRVEIEPGSFGTIDIKEKISVPKGKTVIISVRKKFGDMGLSLGASFAEEGYCGYLKLQLSNRSTKLAEINKDEPVVNFIVVDAHHDDIIVPE
jgi:deoxycytidine triphosphate deaminase